MRLTLPKQGDTWTNIGCGLSTFLSSNKYYHNKYENIIFDLNNFKNNFYSRFLLDMGWKKIK